jgi:hypothetical protein
MAAVCKFSLASGLMAVANELFGLGAEAHQKYTYSFLNGSTALVGPGRLSVSWSIHNR